MSELKNWRACSTPDLPATRGRYVVIERALFPDAAKKLFPVVAGHENESSWRHIPIGPFGSVDEFAASFDFFNRRGDWQTYIFSSPEGAEPLGMASYMRVRAEVGSVEVGCIVLSKNMQRTAASTEAMYLMAKHVFDDLGYRRYEWKCNNANEASKRAALRLGFVFEGVFRQDMVMKGVNRDTAWYSVLDKEWPCVKTAYERWLAPENFDDGGRQKARLEDIRAAF